MDETEIFADAPAVLKANGAIFLINKYYLLHFVKGVRVTITALGGVRNPIHVELARVIEQAFDGGQRRTYIFLMMLDMHINTNHRKLKIHNITCATHPSSQLHRVQLQVVWIQFNSKW